MSIQNEKNILFVTKTFQFSCFVSKLLHFVFEIVTKMFRYVNILSYFSLHFSFIHTFSQNVDNFVNNYFKRF